MKPRVIVVGGGVMGLSTAWALRHAGCEVTLFDQASLPNERGSSVDQHRLIRHAYGAEEGYTRMIQHAFAAWGQMWEDLGTSYYHQTGTFVGVSNGQTWAQESLATLTRVGIPVERLTQSEMASRWPFIRCDDFDEAFYLATGGALFTRALLTGLTRYLWTIGVDIRQQQHVIDVDLARATVHLAGGYSEQGDTVVVAAGPWVTKLLPKTRALVTPSRQTVFYVTPPAKLQQAWSTAPMLLDIGSKNGIYVVPPVAGASMKVGDHSFSMSGDPDHQRIEKQGERQQIESLCSRRFHDFHRYRTGEARICFYTVQPEERFILKRDGPSLVMTGFSGHGFKFGALMGQAARAAVLDPDSAPAIEQWAAGRTMHLPFDIHDHKSARPVTQ